MELDAPGNIEIRLPYLKEQVYILSEKGFWRYYGGPSEETEILVKVILDDDTWYFLKNDNYYEANKKLEELDD